MFPDMQQQLTTYFIHLSSEATYPVPGGQHIQTEDDEEQIPQCREKENKQSPGKNTSK